ncbi:HlyC/CorC family transporter [bacterium]|nr:HlyC/CorC family transporter [bacterium]
MHADSSGLDVAGVVWRLGATLFFVVLNGFFVAAEFSLVKVRAGRIQELADMGKGSAKRVKHILQHLDLYLSACQLGITLASLALGALGEPVVSRLLLAVLGGLGITVSENSTWMPIVSITLAFTTITVLHMTIGEQAPKMMALRRPHRVALGSSALLRAFTLTFRPFIVMINGISNWFLRIAGLPSAGHGAEPVPTAEEIRSILSLSVRAGNISDQQYDVVRNILHLIELEARHIMVPRVDVEYLSLEDAHAENLEVIRRSKHSRFPLCETGLDSVLGVVHVKNVLDAVLAPAEIDLRSLSSEPLLVPDTMALSDLLQEMQTRSTNLATVIDEHGTLVGIAFREDALEEIVGPLGDEFDNESPDIREVEEGVWDVQGGMAFPDFCARLEMKADDEGEETVGGYLIARLGRMPRQGDVVTLAAYELTAAEIGRRRITRIRVTRLQDDIDGNDE